MPFHPGESHSRLAPFLSREGQKSAAVAAASQFLSRNPAAAAVLAQRGFLRRQLKDVAGAIADFSGALSLRTLRPDSHTRVAAALKEARYFIVADPAFKALAARDWSSALRYARWAQAIDGRDEAIFRVSIEALAQSGRTQEALKEANALGARGHASGQAYAQRGYLRERLMDHAGAIADFATALDRGGLQLSERQGVQRSLTIATSTMLEERGEPERALQELSSFAQRNPRDAGAWFALGSFQFRHQRPEDAVAAFENGLAIERRGDALLGAGYASVYVDRSQEAQYFREALDRWSTDSTLNTRPPTEFETIRVQLTESEWSVRTNVVFGNIIGRSKRWGGTQYEPSFETAVRFDGRYLPYVGGLEAFVGGQWRQDQTLYTESYSRLGIRYRPFDGINFNVSGEYQHRLRPRSLDQFALSWAYGFGGFAYAGADAGAAVFNALQPQTVSYPFESGWRPLVSASNFGTYRTGEHRYLQDAIGLLGYAYWSASPYRAVIAPSLMGAASYNSIDARPLAFGAGPALAFRSWLGGDAYRAFDGLLTVQMGYLFPFGESRREGGLRTTVGVTF